WFRDSVFRWNRIRRRRAIRYLLAKQASDQFHHAARGPAALVEERIEFHDIERMHDAGIVQELHDQMRLAIGRAARHRGADARRHFGIEEVDIKTQMQDAIYRLHLVDDAADQDADAELVDLAHVHDADAAKLDEILLQLVDRARAEQF